MSNRLPCLTLIAFLGFLLVPITVLADGNGNGGNGDDPIIPDPNIDTPDALFELLGKIVGWVLMFVIVVAAVMIIWAGFNFITASGDAEKAKKARNMLTYALLGVVIAVAVRGLLTVVAALVGVSIGDWLPF